MSTNNDTITVIPVTTNNNERGYLTVDHAPAGLESTWLNIHIPDATHRVDAVELGPTTIRALIAELSRALAEAKETNA